MKKLLLLSVVLFALAGCSKDETTDSGRQADPSAAFVPHFYGAAMLENPAPETRGVANKMKLWSKSMAEEELTVKFLNGIPEYRAYVKEVAGEWEKAAGVRFIYVNDDQEAMIRIGFDYVRGMQTSWSYTGTDILQLYDMQDEPTIHFAQWRRISDEKKRSDVLRSFGQTLGLELEFRHPMLDPGWIRNEDGTVNEAKIQSYWEDELAEFISWDELKKMVLDPIGVNARFIAKTDYYDQNSVMNWPFFDEIAHSQQAIKFDSDYKTELSELDKEFIKSLYGESLGGAVEPGRFFPLIEFEYTGNYPNFTVTTTKNLEVRWDYNVTNECTQYYLPTDTTSRYTVSIDHSFEEAKTRRIVIGEILDYGQTKPDYSYALTKFDFSSAYDAGEIDIKMLNHGLTYIRINGGSKFTSREFNFNGWEYLKELYLVGIRDSKVVLDNCSALETFATSMYVWKPNMLHAIEGELEPGIIGEHVIEDAIITPIIPRWPNIPEQYYSISDTGGGLEIKNCKKLKQISLENTRITNIDSGSLPALEYVYLSSFGSYIVGGGTPEGQFLLNFVNKLNAKGADSKGLIVLRGIGSRKLLSIEDATVASPPYLPLMIYNNMRIDRTIYNSINQSLATKNWDVTWDTGVVLLPVL